MIKVCKDCMVPKANIKSINVYSAGIIRKAVRGAKKESKTRNYCGNKTPLSCVELHDGTMYLVDASIETLMKRWKKEGEE